LFTEDDERMASLPKKGLRYMTKPFRFEELGRAEG
jgi:hypothetical protein